MKHLLSPSAPRTARILPSGRVVTTKQQEAATRAADEALEQMFAYWGSE